VKRKLAFGIVVIIIVIGITYLLQSGANVGSKEPVYSGMMIQKPAISANPPVYSFSPQAYSNPEYTLPLAEMPENYQRDFEGSFAKVLSEDQKSTLLNNGVVIINGDRDQKFSDAYTKLSGGRWSQNNKVPIFITTDSTLHLFHIEFNEILKNLEVKELSPRMKAFLDAAIIESTRQYNGLKDAGLKELARRNIAYLATARKLLDPSYGVPFSVSSDVNEEISKIEAHKGLFRSHLFSKDCDATCSDLAFYPDGSCSQAVKGMQIQYQGKTWDSMDLYRDVCSKVCYCEDYSQYVPRGHYTSSEELKQYFKSMMWLGRMTFKAKGEGWTKQAILLTDAVKSARAQYSGTEIPAYQLWDKVYSVTGFFAGSSDDLSFYDYDNAVNSLFGSGFDETNKLGNDVAEQISGRIREQRGPKILGGFEIDLVGNLSDATQGMRLMGQRYALDSQILGDLVYKNVGPNTDSGSYSEVLDYCVATSCNGMPVCSKPKEFYTSCDSMNENATKYWNEVCDAAIELYCGCGGCSDSMPPENLAKVYSVCRFMPSGLDVMNALGSGEADDMLLKYYENGFCNYTQKMADLRGLVGSYSTSNWTQNLYNTWLWMLQPILQEKPIGYPIWMRSDVWKTKDLITSLSSWAELRHDTILYVKQSYTWAVGITLGSAGPMEARYYGYVEPNPELFTRAKFAVDFLKQGLDEQGVMTTDVENALKQSSDMMSRLKAISEKELRGEELTEGDYNYIQGISPVFDDILEKLASATTVTSGSGNAVHTSLEGKDEAFKTSLIADVHTDVNSKRVLEAGTGNIDWVVVAHKAKDGRIGIAIGPIFSYYEFTWPMKDRLTDEKWRSTVLGTMKRPVWYNELGIGGTSDKAYIIGPEK